MILTCIMLRCYHKYYVKVGVMLWLSLIHIYRGKGVRKERTEKNNCWNAWWGQNGRSCKLKKDVEEGREQRPRYPVETCPTGVLLNNEERIDVYASFNRNLRQHSVLHFLVVMLLKWLGTVLERESRIDTVYWNWNGTLPKFRRKNICRHHKHIVNSIKST